MKTNSKHLGRNSKHQTPNTNRPPVPVLWKNSPKMLDVFTRIAAERMRQRELFHTGRILFDCASPTPDENRKLRVLIEEVGEVAKELDNIEAARSERAVKFSREDLHNELVHVAAVAVAWLESLEAR